MAVDGFGQGGVFVFEAAQCCAFYRCRKRVERVDFHYPAVTVEFVGIDRQVEARVVLVLVTSNYAPEGLLPNPLYHARFKPVIDLINARMQVMEVGGPHDYRSQARTHTQQVFTQGHYIWPGTAQQRQALQLPDRNTAAFALTVGARVLQARLCDQRSVRFEFSDLCDQPTAVMDYLELSRRFDTWIIDELPDLGECSIAAQQRFINLIDVLYDQDKRLLLIGELPLRESLGGNAIDLARTRSRLGQLLEIGPETPLG